MTDYAGRIGKAQGDAAALLILAIEMAQEVARLESAAHTLRAADEARRAGQAQRTRRHRNAQSRDVTLQSVTECDGAVGSPSSPPPQVSLLSPTPPNNPSFPPTPPTPPSSGGAPKAVRIRDDDPRFAALWAIYPRRSGGNSRAEAFAAFRARLGAGVDPSAMHAGVERYAAYIRANGQEGTTYVKQAKTFLGPGEHWLEPWDGAPKSAAVRVTSVSAADDAAWSAMQDVVAKLARNQLTADEYRALPAPMQAGLRAVGGWSAIREIRQQDVPFRKRDFLTAYRAAELAGAA